MKFVEGKIEEEKEFGGVVFPKTLNPPKGEEYGTDELVEMVRGNCKWLGELLQHHSAILLRGFGVRSAHDFGRVVEAFGWEEMGYMGPGTRNKVAHRVQTVSEAPLHHFLNFHHEMSLMAQFPSKLLFFCSQPSPEGGQTSIVPSHIIVQKMVEMVPEFVSKISEIGCIFTLKTPAKTDSNNVISKTWQSFLQTQDEAEARKRAQEKLSCSTVKFNEDGSAELLHGPVNPIRQFGERKVWFSHILGYTSKENDPSVTFGDGTHFPCDALDAYRQLLDENCVDLTWQKGDVLLLDNLCVQHARRPGKPPRVVLVSMCK